MVLSRLTKITGPGVATDTNWVGNNADFTGITTTATSFNIGVTTIHSTLIESHNIVSTGIITATGGSFSGNVTAVDGTFSGNVSIAGTLTYEDVTNIDSVGIITAPALDVDDFLDVGSNIKLGNAGVITATSFVGSGAALTGIDATAIKDSGGNVKVQAQASGAVYTGIHTFNSGAEVGSNIKLGNAGVVTATSFTGSGANLTSLPAGQLTGIVADARISTLTASKLSGALPAISGANLTNLDASDLASGTVPTARLGSGTANSSTFLRGDSTFAAVTSTTINNNANNRVITGSGTANTLNGEADLVWDGSRMGVLNQAPQNQYFNTLVVGNNSAGDKGITIRTNNTSKGVLAFSDTDSADANRYDGYISYQHSDQSMRFNTNGANERLRITSGGDVLIADTSNSLYNDSSGGGMNLKANGQLVLAKEATSAADPLIWLNDTGQTTNKTILLAQDGTEKANIGLAGNDLTLATAGTERLRIDSSGRVLIGGGSSPSQVGDGRLIVYADTRLHPAIKADCIDGGINRANGFTLLADNYQPDESICNFGISYSGAGLVLSRGVKVSNAADDTYLSSMDSFAMKPAVFKLDDSGDFKFLNTDTSATTTTDSAVTLYERLRITSEGKVQLPTANSTNTYLNVKNIGISRISTSERLAITDIGAVAYDYELDDIMVYRSAGYWSGIDNPRRRGRIRTQNLRAALNFDIGHNPQDNALLAATVFHNLDYGSSFAISGSVASTLRTSSGLDGGPYWNRQMAGGNVGSNFIVADLGGNATTQEVSACCWYKSQSNDSEGTGSGGQYGPAIALFGDTRNSVWGGFGITSRKPDFNSNGNVHNIATSAPSVVDGSWHHIVYTYDGPNADLKIYVDGTLYLTNNSVNCSSNVRYDRIAGHYNYSYTTYPHNMANVLIYDRIISANDVKGIYYARTFYRDTI